jgi:hypothetical protein
MLSIMEMLLPIPCSLFDETLPSFINEKKHPSKKGKREEQEGRTNIQKRESTQECKMTYQGEQRRATKPYVLNLSLVMRSK